ncbi:MAG TPA: asparaginase [Chloroflexi bacterium]|nr:asparaginase [Chloroflexota bacterium]
MGRVAVLTTGGTVAMRYDPEAGGPIPLLSPEELTASLPPGAPELALEAICNLPSSHFTVETLWRIRERAAAWAADPGVDGVVITHGTDTLEETAYLLDLTVPGETPIVVTGAMRSASDPGYDGPANLWASIRVAASPQARGLGALVVLNDEIHAARFVTKMDTLSTATFQSPGWGPLGRVEGDQVYIPWRLEREVIPCRRLEERVALIKLGVGMPPDPLEDALRRGVRGVVLEGLGGGRIPPWWLPTIERAVAEGVIVVVASRCPGGRVWDAYGYRGAHRTLRELGCLFSPHLNGQKARVRLMVVLGSADSPEEVARLWKRRAATE